MISRISVSYRLEDKANWLKKLLKPTTLKTKSSTLKHFIAMRKHMKWKVWIKKELHSIRCRSSHQRLKPSIRLLASNSGTSLNQ